MLRRISDLCLLRIWINPWWVYLSFHFPDPRACSSRSFYLSTHLAVNGAGGADPTRVPERGSIFWVPKLLGGVPLMSPEGCLHATDDDTHPFLQQRSASNCVHAGRWRGEDREHPSCRRWLHGYHRWQAGTWIFSVMKLSWWWWSLFMFLSFLFMGGA